MNFKESLINNNSILLQASATDWREAIALGTGMLIKSGAIQQSHHDAIISSIELHGPYIVIAPHSPCLTPVRRWGEPYRICAGDTEYPVFFDGEPVDKQSPWQGAR